MPPSPRERILSLLATAVRDGCFVKLTLGCYRGSDATLENLTIRPVELKNGPHLSFLWRHTTQHFTKNSVPADGLAQIGGLLGSDFHDAHLFTTVFTAHLQTGPDGKARFRFDSSQPRQQPPLTHDAPKTYPIPPDAPWLQTLGVTNSNAQPREGMADKFRQIQKFAELLQQFVQETAFPAGQPLRIVDMGAGKGYLTFAVADLLAERADVCGIEARPNLVATCNECARTHQFAPRLRFVAGTIVDTPLEQSDVLIALHACDTATDDALAKGISAGARLLVVAPCCQKELRPQLVAPPVLADALRHGIFQERQAEFVTDALRAQLLEWAGYRTRVLEFISTEHTAKNLMIAAIQTHPRQPADGPVARRIRDFAAFYGIRSQALARQLGFALA